MPNRDQRRRDGTFEYAQLDLAPAREPARCEHGESYTVEQIREAFAHHSHPDDWGVKSFYEDGLIAALRGEYDHPDGAR